MHIYIALSVRYDKLMYIVFSKMLFFFFHFILIFLRKKMLVHEFFYWNFNFCPSYYFVLLFSFCYSLYFHIFFLFSFFFLFCFLFLLGYWHSGDIEVNQPILTACYKVGLNTVNPNGKECRTLFRRISFNGTTSVVYCNYP